MKPTTFASLLGVCAISAFWPASVVHAAPYELTVYADDLTEPGEFEVESIFSVARPRPDDDIHTNKVGQMLVEVDYGLGRDWSLGLELPGVIAGETRKLEGLALELQYVAPHDNSGWYWGIRGDVGHESSVYEGETGSSSADLNPIVGYRSGAFHVVVNPSLEIPFQGEESHVTFQPAVKLATRVAEGQDLGVEYYGNWGPISALLSPTKRDETLYAVWDKKLSFGQMNIGLGRGLHPDGGSADIWVTKVGLQLELD